MKIIMSGYIFYKFLKLYMHEFEKSVYLAEATLVIKLFFKCTSLDNHKIWKTYWWSEK